MRILLMCALLGAGCGGSSTPPVSVQFSQAMGTPATLGTGFASSEGKVTLADGMITLESHTVDGDLLIMCDDPTDPITIAVDEHFLQVNYTLPDGTAWGSTIPDGDTAGTVTFKTVVSPVQVTIKHMAMTGAGSPAAPGTFFIDGDAEFAQ
jgi:hypothetical protein